MFNVSVASMHIIGSVFAAKCTRYSIHTLVSPGVYTVPVDVTCLIPFIMTHKHSSPKPTTTLGRLILRATRENFVVETDVLDVAVTAADTFVAMASDLATFDTGKLKAADFPAVAFRPAAT